MTMQRIPIEGRLFKGPTRVVVEAAFDAIYELNLDECEGEHYDTIFDVVSVEADRDNVTFETCRTIERPGRGSLTIPRPLVEALWVARKDVTSNAC